MASSRWTRGVSCANGTRRPNAPLGFSRNEAIASKIRARSERLGLGLAIDKAISELRGGSIHAESAGRGQGATFVVELPLA